MEEIRNAEFIIVGGGAVGCGVAYALAKAGKKDILLLERGEQLGQATTSQGAGLCGQVRDSAERIKLAMHSVATFRQLQKESEIKPEWQEVGSLRIALSEKRAKEFNELHQTAQAAGLETALLGASEASRRWPLMDFNKATAILWCPTDGCMTPVAVVKAYEHQCKKMGVSFATSVTVEQVEFPNGQVSGIRTNRGSARCSYLINAAGAHAHHVAKLVGLDLPIIPVRHEYYITIPLPGLSPTLPCFRVPELTLYGRVRDKGLLLGGWEPDALRTDPRDYALQGEPPAIQPDWKILDLFEQSFASLFPTSKGVAKQFIGKGWPTFTPDGRFIIGESRRVPGFVMAGGCNAHGISGSGGIGRLLVESLFDAHPSPYVTSLSPDRFTESKWTWEEATRHAQNVYETYYGV